MIISELLTEATHKLASHSDSPRLDAELLLCHVLKKNRTWLIAWSDQPLDNDDLQSFHHDLAQRQSGQPIAHIIGQREFWSLPLAVTKDTLIPRPDTELLVEQILEAYPLVSDDLAAEHPAPDNRDRPLRLVDLGTGSGAIALALASERPSWQIIATDVSEAALQVARDNARQLGLDNIEFIQGAWFEPLQNERFDIIVSNPPYIPQDDPHLQQGDVRFEPLSALAAGQDGLDDIRLIVEQAQHHLNKPGLLIIEHGYDQQQAVWDIFHNCGVKNINQSHDLGKNPRCTSGKYL